MKNKYVFSFFLLWMFGCVQAQKVQMLTTDVTRTFDLTRSAIPFDKVPNQSSDVITLNPGVRFQSIDGFGAAVTGATCYNLSLMPKSKRRQFLEETFSSDAFGFNYVRVSIGCSDFSLSEYTCCDKPGIENFALTTEETKYIIPVLKEILEINPALKIMGTPWTCPKWMKVKSLDNPVPFDSWTNGQLNPRYYRDYALYFVKWIQAFQSEGIPIYSITPQNEPLNRRNSASLYMSWEEERDFVKTALGPELNKAHLNVKIYAFDHNYNYDNFESQFRYPVRIYDDAVAAKFFAGAAYHNYGGNPDEMAQIHLMAPEKELVFSEASIGVWNDGRDLAKSLIRDMEDLGLGTVNNWCRGAIVWNLMLDNDMGPHRGEGACATCYGAVDIDNTNYSTIMRNSHYYVMAHMGCFIKSGAMRISTNHFSKPGLTYAAFVNSDGSFVLVASNRNETSTEIKVSDGRRSFSLKIPARGIISCKW